MNIGYLIKFKWHPPTGGAPAHAYQVARQLVKRGHQLHTIYYHHANPMAKVYRQRELAKFLKNIDILYIRVDGDFGYEIFTKLKVVKLWRLPVVWEINSPLEELLVRGKTQTHVDKLNKKRLALAKLVDAAICVSEANGEYAREKLKIKNVYIVPNGSDPDFFSPEKRRADLYANMRDKFKVIWSGSAQYKWHGLDLINAIATKIYDSDKGIAFILIGSKDELTEGRKWAGNVQIFDKKEYSEIPEFMASADAGLCLYNENGIAGKFYFSPLKLFDYMACGLPVIATGIGQIKDVIEHNRNGLLVDNQIDQICRHILMLKNNPAEAKRIGAEARNDIVKHYNWGRVALETEKVLEGLL